MVSVLKGLDVRKSRFAALSHDQDSSDEDEEKQWQQVLPTKSKPPNKKSPPSQGGQTQGEAKGLSKNAKKRARKRRNKSTSSDHDVSELNYIPGASQTLYLLPYKVVRMFWFHDSHHSS